MNSLHDERLARAALSLDGLSVGDAFGEQFFVDPDTVDDLIDARTFPSGLWRYTDDTEMALSVVSILRQHRGIRQELLAKNFGIRYDRTRGYGPAMHRLLPPLGLGLPWQQASASLFSGQGSYGNGSAMRVAPVGAYFADALDRAIEHAKRSAVVTHAHPEAVVGAIATAVAAALAWQTRMAVPNCQQFLDLILPHVPESIVREKIRHARNLPPDASVRLALSALGNGVDISAQDTVPFVLWCAGQHLDSYEEALWLTVSGLGDRDTTCAMVGGIVALSAGAASIPDAWLAAREPLPRWPFQGQSKDW